MAVRIWIVDDDPNPRFPEWTRGAAARMFGGVVPPLVWSLMGVEMEAGWRDALIRFGAFTADELDGAEPCNLAVFGGYLYLNASTARVLASRAPGLTPAQVDAVVLGGDGSTAPPSPGRSLADLRAAARVRRRTVRALPDDILVRLDQERDAVTRWRTGLPLPITSSDEILLRTANDYRRWFRPLFAQFVHLGLRLTVPLQRLTRVCGERLGDSSVIPALLAGLADAESAEPERDLWRYGRMVAADGRLTDAFDDGLHGLERRLTATPGGASLLARIAVFQNRFGHLGGPVWDPTVPVWGNDVGLVLAEVDFRRRRGDDDHPDLLAGRRADERARRIADVRARLPRADRRRFDRAVHATAELLPGRERARHTLFVALHGFRLAAGELNRRAVQRGGEPNHLWLVTADELADYLHRPASYRSVLAARAGVRAHLTRLDPPERFEGSIPPPSTWRVRHREIAPSPVSLDPIVGGLA